MKTKLIVILFVSGLLIFWGCKKITTNTDTTPPTVQIISPTNNSTISGEIAIEINVTDNNGISKVEIYINGNLSGETTSAPWGFSWDTEQEVDGNYTIQAKAYDTSDNFSTSDLVNVIIQNELPVLFVNTTLMDFGSFQNEEVFNISNNGEGTLNWNITDDQDWISVDPTTGSDEGNKSTITVSVDRNGLDLGSYQGIISITSNGGSATVAIQMEVEEAEEFLLTFNNPLFTDIEVTVDGHSTLTAESGFSAVFVFDSNPGSITYHAETSGQTTSGTQVGLLIEWDYTHDVSEESSLTLNLSISSDYVFFYVQNTSDHILTPFYVNYGTTYQTMDNILLPNNGLTYRTGYYQAFIGMEVRSYWQDMPSWYFYWIQGTHFSLPFTNNQSVTLLAISSRENTGEDEIVHYLPDTNPGTVISGTIPKQNFRSNGICNYGIAKE